MSDAEIDMKLDFPPELLDCIEGRCAIIAGGAVLRRLLRVPTDGTDIDVFFWGADAAVHVKSVIRELGLHGYMPADATVASSAGCRRNVLVRAGQHVDLVMDSEWDDAAEVLDSFDLSAAKVGYYPTGALLMLEDAVVDLLRKELHIYKTGIPTPP